MSLLLRPDQVALYSPAGGSDEHGWELAGTRSVWDGHGNYQPGPGWSDPTARDAGGRGPHAPAGTDTGNLYLPPEAPVADGMVAVVNGTAFTLGQARLVRDPRGVGDLDCWVTAATRKAGS